MNGVHDLGGMHGFGPVRPEENEPTFHERWEATVFAIVQATRATKLYNIDEFRYGIERMDPAHYLRASYYEKWLASAERNLAEKGLITPEEMSARIEQLRRDPSAATPPVENPALLQRVREGKPRDWPPQFDPATQRFQVGDAVMTRNLNPVGHIRLPRYTRGKRGVIDQVRGRQALPDISAQGRPAPKETVYSVRFAGRELWGNAAEPGQTLYIDLWESYLEPESVTTD